MCIVYGTENGYSTGENELSNGGGVGIEAIDNQESVDLFEGSKVGHFLPYA